MGQIGLLSVFFVKNVLLGNSHAPFILLMDAFMIWWQSWVISYDRRCGPQKPKYLLLSHLQNNFIHSWSSCSQTGRRTQGCSYLLTRVLGLVQVIDPWWAMKNAKEILTSFKNIANITFTMRKGEKSYNTTLSSLSWLARYQTVSMPQDLTLHTKEQRNYGKYGRDRRSNGNNIRTLMLFSSPSLL